MLDASMIQVIPNTPRVDSVQFTPTFSTICSVGKAPFWGTVTISFRPDTMLLEFESFETWLHSMAQDHQTIEDLCRRVFDALTLVLGFVPMFVEVNAETTVHAPASARIERVRK